MGLLLMMSRKLTLIRRKNNIQYQMVQLNQKLNEIQNLSGVLSSDNVTLADIAGMPASLFSQGIASLQQGHMMGLNWANNVMMTNGSLFAQYGPQAQQMQQIAFMKAYETGRTQYNKMLQAQINEKEKQIQQEKTLLDAEYETVKEELDNIKIKDEVSSSVCHYGLQQ